MSGVVRFIVSVDDKFKEGGIVGFIYESTHRNMATKHVHTCICLYSDDATTSLKGIFM